MTTISVTTNPQKIYGKSSYNSGMPIKVYTSQDSLVTIRNSSSVITAQNSNYQRTKQLLLEIDDTDCENDEDEWGATRPTRYAWQLSLEILQEIEKLMQTYFPLGFASLDSDGGIELVWKNYKTTNEIRISVPATNKVDISLYIRYYSNEKSKLLANPSINQLVIALQFLYQ